MIKKKDEKSRFSHSERVVMKIILLAFHPSCQINPELFTLYDIIRTIINLLLSYAHAHTNPLDYPHCYKIAIAFNNNNI